MTPNEGLPLLLRFANDPDSNVRWQVMRGLPDVADTFSDSDPAVAALLQGKSDPDPDVREAAEQGLLEVLDWM